MKMARHTLAVALMCLLATHCAVEASRLGPVRKLSQVSGGLGELISGAFTHYSQSRLRAAGRHWNGV